MKTIATLMVLGALSFTGCAHNGHGHHHGKKVAGEACCKDKKDKDCKDGSCKMKKGKDKAKGKSCCK